MTSFTDLGLGAPLLDALASEGYSAPTPIQAQAIPHVLAGRDLLGIAQTGSGKTAAFALPILQHLAATKKRAPAGGCRVLVLSPTRELASQIADSFRTYGKKLRPSVAVVFGGVGHAPQTRQLRAGVDVVVATPGRLLDHLNQRNLRLSDVEIFVLDEADRMLDMGFIRDIRRIAPLLPKVRQNLFFSATMPGEIDALAGSLLRDPAKVAVTPVATTVDTVEQHVVMVDSSEKRAVLADILRSPGMGRTLVFTRTKRGADRVVDHLEKSGIAAAAIHGNKSQGQRERALEGFRDGQCRILIATDIAARGIDVDAITHVINFDIPNISESYVHRIGRTARAGAAGVAISLCEPGDRAFLRDIERLIRQSLNCVDRRGHAVTRGATDPAPRAQSRPAGRPQQPRGRGGFRGRRAA